MATRHVIHHQGSPRKDSPSNGSSGGGLECLTIIVVLPGLGFCIKLISENLHVFLNVALPLAFLIGAIFIYRNIYKEEIAIKKPFGTIAGKMQIEIRSWIILMQLIQNEISFLLQISKLLRNTPKVG